MKKIAQKPKILALHGFTLSGAVMKRQMGDLAIELAHHVELVFPDAPHSCSTESVKRLYKSWRATLPAPPYRRWWNASSEGLIYEGWSETKEFLSSLLEEHKPAGIIGFSQGAIVAAAVAALGQAKRLPPVDFAIFIAGATPRSDDLKPYFQEPIDLPSLHIWGDEDEIMSEAAPELSRRFSPVKRECCPWAGRHELPDSGPAAEAIVDFVKTRLSA